MKERGITLIALVVTIIILVILAAVTINLVFNNNGLLFMTQEAKEKYQKEQAREEVVLILSEWQIQKYTQRMELFEFLKTKPELSKVEKNVDNTITVVRNGYTFQITETGEISNLENDVKKDAIDLLNEIYVQHDVSNNDVYELKKDGLNPTTKLYKNIRVDYKAASKWTKTGTLVSDDTNKLAASTIETAVPVKVGEEYFIKIYGEGGDVAPVLFLDDANNVVQVMLNGTYSSTKVGTTITVPNNATKMVITRYTNQDYALQKVVNVTSEEFEQIASNQDKQKISLALTQRHQKFEENPTVYAGMDKAYITFCNDDTSNNIDQYADLFISQNVPLCLATIPELLIDATATTKETRLEVCRRVVQNGGEILAHTPTIATEEKTADYNFMFQQFYMTKKKLQDYGFEVNTTILSGGAGLVTNKETEKWATALYKSSDLYGMPINGVNSTYNWGRTSLAMTLDKAKQKVDEAIANKKWEIFYFHNFTEMSQQNITELINYIKAKSPNKVEIVNYKTMYDKFAKKSTEVVGENKTYYVAEKGISNDGISPEEPMSMETLSKKK